MAAPAPAPAPVVVAPPATPAPTVESKAKPMALAPHLDPANDLSRVRSVYFDFDRAVLRADATPVIEMHGKYLAGAGDLKVVVEGNTDERGSSEYNLALGQRRAEAVVKQLKVIGAKDSQLEATSYGKERPAAAGHDEGAWSQNRRADIVYK
jgi:peptidoglycan-associated lipoprotein